MKVPILAYHKIQNGFEFGINKVSLNAFEKQIKYLHETDYQTVSLANLKNENKSKISSKAVVITFDDGDESIFYNAFPILDSHPCLQ